eukprot:Hpha_TRINITY_DN22257_c0_g1::TRINITY_DN22257_c0_g1_i1::g.167102::m.167102
MPRGRAPWRHLVCPVGLFVIIAVHQLRRTEDGDGVSGGYSSRGLEGVPVHTARVGAALHARVASVYDLAAAARLNRRPSAGEGGVPLRAGEAAGHVHVDGAAWHCTCPAIVPGGSASAVLSFAALGAFGGSTSGRAGDVTDRVRAVCRAKSECVWELPARNGSCRPKVVVDYSCADGPLRTVTSAAQIPQQPVLLRISCAHPSQRVHWSGPVTGSVTPVRYAYSGKLLDVWPISFSVPESLFRGTVGWKDRVFANTIPGNPSTYGNTQQTGAVGLAEPDTDYFTDYRRAYFCVTRKKAGWDALRHYEVLAMGCVPYFVDVLQMPLAVMPNFPRALVLEAMGLEGVHVAKGRGDMWFGESFEVNTA